jgi:hypothetical protein
MATALSSAACTSVVTVAACVRFAKRGMIPMNDPRIAELTELSINEGIKLPLPLDIILWLEDRGCVVDLMSGNVEYTTRQQPPSSATLAATSSLA